MKQTIQNFLKISTLNSLLLKPTSEDEEHKLISQLNIGKTLGALSIPVTILKDNVSISSHLQSFIINGSFEKGIFPGSLKSAQVTQVYKKKALSQLVTTTQYFYCQSSVKYLKNLCITEFTSVNIN